MIDRLLGGVVKQPPLARPLSEISALPRIVRLFRGDFTAPGKRVRVEARHYAGRKQPPLLRTASDEMVVLVGRVDDRRAAGPDVSLPLPCP
jgi:hypothetical protein